MTSKQVVGFWLGQIGVAFLIFEAWRKWGGSIGSDHTAALVGLGTLLVLVGQTGIFWWQASVMRLQAGIYERQATVMVNQLTATKIAAEAAMKAADAAVNMETARVFVDSFMFVRSGMGNLAASLQGPNVRVQLINYGRTPAVLQQECAQVFIGTALPAPLAYPDAYDLQHGRLLQPGASYGLRTATLPRFLTAEEIEAVLGGSLTLWVYGYLFYIDLFGRPHWCNFQAMLVVPRANSQKEAQFVNLAPNGLEDHHRA